MNQADLEKMQATCKLIEARIDELSLELATKTIDGACGYPCEKCGGRGGNPVTLAGGYETILCRPCLNLWTVAIHEAGLWLAYRTAQTRVEVARDVVKAGIRAGHKPVSENAPLDAVTCHVEDLVLAERKLFEFATKWLAGGTP